MATKNLKASDHSTNLMRKGKGISDVVETSKIVKESMKAYESAPIPIKNAIDAIKTYEYNRISDMFSSTLKQPVEPEALDKLAMVAAVETVRSSPVFISMVKEFAEEKRLSEIVEFTNWTDKYMTTAVRNMMSFIPKDANLDSHLDIPDALKEDKGNVMINAWLYERYLGSSDALEEKRLGPELGKWLDERANALDDAIKTVGTKRRVLMVIGKSEKEIENILENESHRITAENQKGGIRLDASDVDIKNFKAFLRMIRESEKEVMHNASNN